MTQPSPFILRAAVAATSGVALTAGWLQFVYERLIVRCSVDVPRWWVLVLFFSLSALVIFTFALRKRDPKLAAISWRIFAFSFLGCVVEAFFGYNYVLA
jgi:hypothetical protein